MFFRLFTPVALLFVLTSCSVMSLDDVKGVLWSSTVDYRISRGIEQHDDAIYFADTNGGIYCLGMDTGSTLWKWRLSNQNIEMICAGGSYLYVVASQTNGTALLYTYNYSDGIQSSSSPRSFPFIPSPKYVLDGNKIITFSESRIAVIDDITLSINSNTSPGVSGIADLVKGSYNWYAITTNCTVTELTPSFNFYNTSLNISGKAYRGSVFFLNNYLYTATDDGVKILDTRSSMNLIPSITVNSVTPTGMIYDPDNSGTFYLAYSGGQGSLSRGIAAYSTNNFSARWQYTTLADVNAGTIFLSRSLKAIGIVDDSGYINIFNRQNGSVVFQNLYLGVTDMAGLKFPLDYLGGNVFIPINSPSTKIVCYSIDWAMKQVN